MEKIYEIHDLTTMELLADNLSFEDVPDLFLAYSDLYPDHEITVCYRLYDKEFVISTPTKLIFVQEWYNFIEQNICNIY